MEMIQPEACMDKPEAVDCAAVEAESSDFDCCAVYSPRTVLEALGLHLSQDPSEKGGILAQAFTGQGSMGT